jgi:chromosome segregation ATPase
MNKMLFYILPLALISSLIMMCSSPAEKVNTAQQEVNQANKDLEKANQEYQQDILNYKKENETRIATNDQLISDFKVRIANEKKAVKDEYNKKIAELEQKNTDTRRKLDEYKAESKEKWESFKSEFNRDMDELGTALSNLTVKNK